jgi:hypothetical protein
MPRRHCGRSEAIHGPAPARVDCFAEPVIRRRFALDPLARNDG